MNCFIKNLCLLLGWFLFFGCNNNVKPSPSDTQSRVNDAGERKETKEKSKTDNLVEKANKLLSEENEKIRYKDKNNNNYIFSYYKDRGLNEYIEELKKTKQEINKKMKSCKIRISITEKFRDKKIKLNAALNRLNNRIRFLSNEFQKIEEEERRKQKESWEKDIYNLK